MSGPGAALPPQQLELSLSMPDAVEHYRVAALLLLEAVDHLRAGYVVTPDAAIRQAIKLLEDVQVGVLGPRNAEAARRESCAPSDRREAP
jgi:hypothetical protein